MIEYCHVFFLSTCQSAFVTRSDANLAVSEPSAGLTTAKMSGYDCFKHKNVCCRNSFAWRTHVSDLFGIFFFIFSKSCLLTLLLLVEVDFPALHAETKGCMNPDVSSVCDLSPGPTDFIWKLWVILLSVAV